MSQSHFDYKSLKPLVNDIKLKKVLDSYVDFMYDTKHTELERLTELPQIYRAQGYIEALRALRDAKVKANAK